MKRAVKEAIASEVGHSEPDDGFSTVLRESIQVQRVSAVAPTGHTAPVKPQEGA